MIIGTGIAYLIGLIIDTDVFRRKAIDVKYCYYWKNDTIDIVHAADKIEKMYQVIAYYYCDVCADHRGGLTWDGMYEFKRILKVEVLEYTEDLLLAKIRYKCYSELSGGIIIEDKTYVPTFSLHDTLPFGYKAKNEEQMAGL